MITPEIISYIKTEKAKNTPDAAIRANLLSNGWNGADISEALASLSVPGVPGAVQISAAGLKKYQTNRIWLTFFILALIDFMIIMYLGGNGLFGVSPVSIVVRIIVIYAISYFTAKGSKPEASTAKAVASSVARVLGAIALAFIIGIGILFAYCYFTLSFH